MELCGNGLDDDRDGEFDCADSECAGSSTCVEVCDNNLDDDVDGKFDCADTDCSVLPACGGAECGNGTVDPGEDCDGTDLGGRSCITQGFKTGPLSCKACSIDTSACSNIIRENCNNDFDDDTDGQIDCDDSDCASAGICLCGNGIIDGSELCDGTQIPEFWTCQTEGFPGGELKCKGNCLGIDTSGCLQPRCGDGFVSPGETCDDGNNTAGDGCDAACLVETAEICAAPLPLVLGVNTGDTTGGSAGFESQCTQGGPERVFTFTPALTGTLTIVLNSPTDQGVYVRSSCDSFESELGCADFAGGGQSEALTLAVTGGVPLFIIVDSDGFAAAAGPFNLLLVLNP